MKALLTLLMAILFTPTAWSAATHEIKLKGSTAASYGYVEYLPSAYHSDHSRRFPIVIFLHGAGEQGSGTDPDWLWRAVTKHGPHKLVEQGETRFDRQGVLLISPQSPEWWSVRRIDEFIDHVVKTYRVDESRIYLTGLSMGGGGVWNYVKTHGERIAACIPICGASGGGDGTKFIDTPTWAFHAWNDGAVGRRDSINWSNDVAGKVWGKGKTDLLATYPHVGGDTSKPAAADLTGAFTASGGWTWHQGVVAAPGTHPKLTLYTTGGHDSWSRTYHNPKVWDWLLAQGSVAAPTPPPTPPPPVVLPPPPVVSPPPPVAPVLESLRVTLRGSVGADVQRVRHGSQEVAVKDGRFALVLALPPGSVEARIQLVAADGQQTEKTVRLERSELGGG